jgi:DNA-binding NarL/FixJ family response regulator
MFNLEHDMRHHFTSDLIRVLVSDDTRVHTELLADALKRDGGLQVTTSASGSEGLIGRLNHHNVDVLLIGSNLDEHPGRGFEVLRGLRSSHGELSAVMLLDSSKCETILEAFRAGARGVFSKQESVDTLTKCVRKVHEGQIWANSQQMTVLVRALASSYNVRAVDARGMNLLSKRELEIVRSVAQGMTNREIATRLGLSPHTVKNCLFRVFDKLGVSGRVELLLMTLSQNDRAESVMPGLLENQRDGKFLDDAAVVAYREAAEEGILTAQLALAEFYWTYGTTPTDATNAYMWYSIAGEQMSRLCAKATKNMTVDQLLQAEQMVTRWLSKREGRSSTTVEHSLHRGSGSGTA